MSSASANPNVNGSSGSGAMIDYFNIGSVVKCTTCNAVQIQGEVMAFDPTSRIIILRGTATSKQSFHHDIQMVNLNMVSDVKIVSEPRDPPPEPNSLNLTRLQARFREQTMRKKRALMAFKEGVSPDGQGVFAAIGKTIDELRWEGDNIVVMGQVTIVPPYKPENLRGNKESHCLKHIKKIVERFYELKTDKEKDRKAPSLASPRDSPPSARTEAPAAEWNNAAANKTENTEAKGSSPRNGPSSSATSKPKGGASRTTTAQQPSKPIFIWSPYRDV